MQGDAAAYFHGLFWRLLLLSERVVRDPTLAAVVGRLGLLLTVIALESRPEEPRLRRPGKKKKRSEIQVKMCA